MATKIAPAGYSFAQIALHWLIAALVVFQLILGEDIVPAYRAWRRGTEASPDDLGNANIHVYVGIAIFALAVIRFAIRLVRGVPGSPPGENALQRWAAAAVHIILYAAIFLMPLTGAAAWFLGIHWLGEVTRPASRSLSSPCCSMPWARCGSTSCRRTTCLSGC